jgi:Ca2+-transporting ATPase
MENATLLDGDSRIVALSPGQLRVQVPSLYRSAQEKNRLERKLSGLESVNGVHASPLTGRVLILFQVSVPAERVIALLGLTALPESDSGRDSRNNHRNTSYNSSRDRIAARTKKQDTTQRAQRPTRKHDIYPAWHRQEADAALVFHDSSERTGLSSEAAEDRLRHGANVLPPPRTRSSLDILLGQFKSLPVLLLGVSAALSVLTGGVSEALAIAAVLTMNAGIGFVTERRAESTIASLSELIGNTVPVLREGKLTEVESSRIVRGDILVLAPGIHVAADVRLVQANGLAIDESAFTGESRPVRKSVTALPENTPLADRVNMAYTGTVVTAGTGLAVVVGTGRNTEIGVVQSLMENTEQPKTPIQKQLDRLGNQLVAASVGVCAAVFAIGLVRGFGVLQMLKSSISLAIAAVPEGLPTVATTSLARSIRRMKARQMLVRKLQAVETLGAIHTICLDKTGTLTMNRMSVVEIRMNGTCYEVENGVPRDPSHPHSMDDPALSRLLQICVLCNESEVTSNGAADSSNGSATENALVELALAAGMSVEEMRRQHALLDAELRGEGRHYMTTVRYLPESGRHLIAVKGSPAEVLALCDTCFCDGRTMPLTPEREAAMLEQNRRMAERRLRVLGFAYAETESPPNGSSPSHLTWLGLTGLADPLRAGAAAVISDLHRAGVRTAMVTGDQSTTARAIGEALGLSDGRPMQVLESDHLERIEPGTLHRLVADADIFARVSPARKLEIVRALQAGSEVVAMTGDGINDGPALQASNVGIAMGLHGTDLARSAADVVLENDRLEAILDAIREGRTLTVNIRKSLHFLISSNMSEIMTVLGALSAGAQPPLSPMQLLWVNLLGDVLPAIALAAEPAEEDVMRQPPRDAARPLIGKEEMLHYAREGVFLSGGTLAAYGYGLLRHGPGARAGAIAFNALMLGQLLHALSCRSDRRGALLSGRPPVKDKLTLAIAGSIGLQLLANVMPGLRGLLGTGPMGAMDIAATLAGAGVPLLLNEAVKKQGDAQSSAASKA